MSTPKTTPRVRYPPLRPTPPLFCLLPPRPTSPRAGCPATSQAPIIEMLADDVIAALVESAGRELEDVIGEYANAVLEKV